MKNTGERGFTLLELVVVIAFFVLMLGLSLFLLRPEDYTLLRNDSKRRTQVAQVVQALKAYQADHDGQLPPGITSSVKAISSGNGHYDLCKYLVPDYLYDMPFDPTIGVKLQDDALTKERCNAEGVTYATGLTIQKKKNGDIVVAAPVSKVESGSTVELTVK
jgi:prepilin-type N-terminal cleavage/methylation domain-containing protein